MHVLYSFPDVVGKAGIGTTAYQQVNEVAKSGVEVTLYCTTLTRELPESVRVVETLSLLGRRVPHRMLGIDRSYRYHDRRVAAALRRVREHVVRQPDPGRGVPAAGRRRAVVRAARDFRGPIP